MKAKIITFGLLITIVLGGCGKAKKGQATINSRHAAHKTLAEAHVIDSTKAATNGHGVSVSEKKKHIPFTGWYDFVDLDIDDLDTIQSITSLRTHIIKRTTPSKRVVVEIIGGDKPITTQIFYYSPRMESDDYSYRKELGSDNNFVGITDLENQTPVYIPDTCEAETKLMLRAIGYEPVDIPIDSIGEDNLVSVRLTPKTYQCTVILAKKKLREGMSKYDATILNERPTRVFYGDCLPIEYGDGNHGDPICAFMCMDCYPEFYTYPYQVYKDSVGGAYKELYCALEEGKGCGFLISVKGMKDSLTMDELPDKGMDKFRQYMRDKNWRVGPLSGEKYQMRVRFTLASPPCVTD